LQARLERNVTPHRLASKFSKNDVKRSIKDLLETAEKYRFNFNKGETICPNHLKINNTNLLLENVVDIIIEKFNLTPLIQKKK